jgi:hypothetical protein
MASTLAGARAFADAGGWRAPHSGKQLRSGGVAWSSPTRARGRTKIGLKIYGAWMAKRVISLQKLELRQIEGRTHLSMSKTIFFFLRLHLSFAVNNS